MEKEQFYVTPAVRVFAFRCETSFLTSLDTGGVIEPGQEDDWGTLNP